MEDNKVMETEAVEKTAEEIAFETSEKERLRRAKWDNFFDKVGNVVLAILAVSPLLILGYIFWWFIAG